MSVTSSRRINVTLSTLSIDDPAAARIAAMLRKRPVDLLPHVAHRPGLAVAPAWPDVKRNDAVADRVVERARRRRGLVARDRMTIGALTIVASLLVIEP